MKGKTQSNVESLLEALKDAKKKGIKDVTVMIRDNDYDLDYTSVSYLTGLIIHIKEPK